MSEHKIVAPEGVEIGFSVYITSDASDLNMVVHIDGLPFLSAFEAEIDPLELAKKTLPDVGIADWRLMTREEIRAYKADEAGEAAV